MIYLHELDKTKIYYIYSMFGHYLQLSYSDKWYCVDINERVWHYTRSSDISGYFISKEKFDEQLKQILLEQL